MPMPWCCPPSWTPPGRQGGLAVRAAATDPVAVNALFDAVERWLGPTEVLVNNIGHREATLVARMSDDQWRRALAANVDGTFHAIRRAAVPMAVGGSVAS